MFSKEGKDKTRAEAMIEIIYYSCIYDVLQDPNHHREKAARLNHLKAKIVRLHKERLQAIIVDTREPATFQEKGPSLFYLLQML
jgi:hypothetical protein